MRRIEHHVAGLDVEIVYPGDPDHNIPRPITAPQLFTACAFLLVVLIGVVILGAAT